MLMISSKSNAWAKMYMKVILYISPYGNKNDN